MPGFKKVGARRKRGSEQLPNLSRLVPIAACTFVLGAAMAAGLMVFRDARKPAGQPLAPVRSGFPRSHYDLLAMSPAELADVDLGITNLVCAMGLPGTEGLDLQALAATLDHWAERVRVETERHLYRATDPRYADHYSHSEARLRAEFLVQVLQEDCGVHYNKDRILDVDFANPADLFVFGMIDNDNGGTCASMPVLYTAVGRRLGYPMKLVLAKQHVFVRWEDREERFNIEAAGDGGVSFFPDEHYRTWPRPISDAEAASGEFLRSLTPAEELAVFLLNRGICHYANGQAAEARACLAEAHRLMPHAPTARLALKSVMSDGDGLLPGRGRATARGGTVFAEGDN
jgi:hypothetical protein